MQLTITDLCLSDASVRLVVSLPPSESFPRGWCFDLIPRWISSQSTQCLSENWLASRQVEPGHSAAAGGVAENLRDDRLGHPALEQGGGHGAPQVVGAQAPVAGAALPAADQRGDVAATALHYALVDIGNRLAAIEATLREAQQHRKQVVADRHPTQAALAAHLEQLGARVDVLQAQASKLATANAKMRERFEDIREALRGAAEWRDEVNRVASKGCRLFDDVRGAARALDQIERLLPPVDVELGRCDLGSDDSGKRIAPAPAVRPGNPEQPTEKP